MNRIAIAAATLALLTACGAGTGDPGETDPTITDGGRPSMETPDMTIPDADGTNGSVPQQMLDDVLALASEDTGVPVDEISVVSAESVTWSDGSLGCPEPGMGYTQALVPGYRVVLNLGGEEVHYHAAQDGEFFRCDNPQAPTDNR